MPAGVTSLLLLVLVVALGLLVLTLGLAALIWLVPIPWLRPWSIDCFFLRVFLSNALRRPMYLSQLRLLEPFGLQFHNDDLDDLSVAFRIREARRAERHLRIARRYAKGRLDPRRRLSVEVLEWLLEDQRRGEPFLFHDYPVNQFEGLQAYLPEFMVTTHTLRSRRDAVNYVRRVEKIGAAIDQIAEGVRHRERLGIVPPRFVLKRVLVQMRGFTDAAPADHVLHTHLRDALDAVGGFSPSRRDRLLSRLKVAIRTVVHPAYGRLIEELTRLEAGAPTDDGVWRMPDGEAYYAWCLRSNTTTDLTADEIHRIGLAEVETIQGQMRAILAGLGLPTDDLAGTMARLNRDPRFLYPDTDEGRAAILSRYRALIEEASDRIDGLFNVRPATGVEVQRVPVFREATAPGAYYQPGPVDGSRPGLFFANLRRVEETPTFGMRTLAYHEAIPGHHFQITVAQGLKGLPLFRRHLLFTAYVEGWGLYAEQLAAESGLQDDPHDRLGYLTAQLFRAARLVVDTGIHQKRWTREQAIDYMLRTTGMPDTDVVAEVERYIVAPGQACAYKLGQMKILELREMARSRLGDRFDIRRFHDRILAHGALPLPLLERVVTDGIG